MAVSLLGFTAAPVQAATPTTSPISKPDRAPGLDRSVRLGPADPTRKLTIGVSLALRNQAALQSFIAGVSDRKSPNYGHYLSPDQFAAAYGPTQAQVQQVVDYLHSHGLAVTATSSNRTLVDATGSLATVQAAFGVTISNWHDGAQNRDFYGNDTQPVLPTTLASYVVGIAGLNNHYPLQRLGPAPRAPPGGGPAGGYTPNDLKKAYDVTPLASAGYNGSGQPLGLFELDGFRQSNITTYDTDYGLGSPAPSVVRVDGGSGPLGNGEVEVELDIEVMHALAPAAPITVWEGPNSDPGVNDTYNAMVTSNTTKSNSTSWGICEQQTTHSEMSTLDNIFQQAAAQGQSFFAASGDYGAYDCGGSFLSVDSPANDPYVTGTGGTTLTLNADGTYKTESAWSNPNYSPPLGSGGGLSTYFARPSWQTGPGVSNSYSNGKRQVPDISSDADSNTGYSVYVTYGGTGWTVVGGTSAAAPSWAAFTAVYNQYAAANAKPNLGYANPTLYSTGSNAQPYAPYHDVTTGDNLYYAATATWDYATGWGTYDANNLARDLAGPAWSATYGVANTPTGWAAYQTQTYSITVTNTGTQTWPATGTNLVHLGVHFASSGGGYGVNGTGTNNGWSTDQRFALPANLAAGGSLPLTISVTAPNIAGNLVLEYQMVKEYQFWFDQFADVSVTAAWSATYSVANTPASWAPYQTQTYNVTVTNTGTQTWPATGTNLVHLGVHFTNPGGGYGVSGTGTGTGGWSTDQRFTLPADLAPRANVTLTISVTAPSMTGNVTLEYQMVKEYQFWFGQFADVKVTPSWAVGYSVSNTPTRWAPNQTQTYSVTVTNTGTETWPSTGTNLVRLGVHFANSGGGYGVSGTDSTWYTNQRFTLPADVGPGASVSLSIAVTGPSNPTGNLVLEYQMVKEYQFWFSQFADVKVSVT
ncbi:MAG TPA: S53 family peptidase [Candidatus Dormibacteraeota bacterium]|nr:S53 family peptidase [Candidatus Dormibacteraeota bacterium]